MEQRDLTSTEAALFFTAWLALCTSGVLTGYTLGRVFDLLERGHNEQVPYDASDTDTDPADLWPAGSNFDSPWSVI